MKRLAVLLALFLSLSFSAKADYFPGLSIGTNTISYLAGSITVNGALTSYVAGSLTSFASSQNNCAPSAINSGTDACEYVYYSAANNNLAHTTSYSAALPYILATVTTNSSGQPLAWQAYTPPPITSFIENQATSGFVQSYYTVTSSTTPAFNRFNGAIQVMTLSGNVTSSTLTGGVLGNWIYLSVVQPASGGPYTMTWPTNMHWPNGTALTIATAASSASGAMCYYSGSTSYGWACILTWSGVK